MELRNTPYRIVPLARAIAYKLYVLHVNDDLRDRLSLDQIAGLFSIPISRNLLRSAIEILIRDRFASRHSVKAEDGPRFRLAEEGIFLVEKALRNRQSDLWYLMEHGDKAIDDIAGPDAIFMTEAERVDSDAWAPLPIDRNDPEYIEALSAVDEALEKIRADNGYAVSNPEERQGVIALIEDGRLWLSSRFPSRTQVVHSLVKPLRHIASKFAESVMGDAAKVAAQRIIDWLAKFF